jgi:hypothetical protein
MAHWLVVDILSHKFIERSGPLQATLLHSEVHVSQDLIAGVHAEALQPADVQLF